MVNMARRAALPWDVILGAEVARAYKPQPEAYLRSAALLDLAPAACMMVAAHRSEFWSRRRPAACAPPSSPVRPSTARTGGAAPPAEQAFDVSATSFIDLAGKLGC